MKLNKLTTEQAERIIVEGAGGGFSMVRIKDIPLTIYHREFEGKHYDIGEMNTYVESLDEVVSTFYELDPEEVKQILK